jgi:hypothetical protein
MHVIGKSVGYYVKPRLMAVDWEQVAEAQAELGRGGKKNNEIWTMVDGGGRCGGGGVVIFVGGDESADGVPMHNPLTTWRGWNGQYKQFTSRLEVAKYFFIKNSN